MASLSDYQADALASYCQLMANYPQLFRPRKQRPIVQDPQILATYMAETGVALGVTAKTPYVYFVVDLVENGHSQGSTYTPYLRVIPLGQLHGGVNVVIVATIANDTLGNLGDLVLIEQERHATGTDEVALPRGFAEAEVSGQDNALKELAEETGYLGHAATCLGHTYTDTGLTDSQVHFYHVPVTHYDPDRRQRDEAIQRVFLASPQEVWQRIHQGQIRDGFTLQGLALYSTALCLDSGSRCACPE